MQLEKTQYHQRKGFTLPELLIVIIVLAILTGLLIPNFIQGKEQARGAACTANLRMIEGAKDAWRRDYPGAAIPNASALLPYLNQSIPSCPDGASYSNMTDLDNPTTCPFNGQASREPSDKLPLDSNGYHDLDL